MVADQDGTYSFPDLADGMWAIQVEMLGFMEIRQEVTVSAGMPAGDWDLKMLSLDEIKALAGSAQPAISFSGPVTEQPPSNTAIPTPAPGTKTAAKKGAAASPTANAQTGFNRPDLKASANAAAANGPEPPPAANSAFAGQDANELSQRASDGFLVNGTVNNGASSPFAQNAAFGNNRRGAVSLYQFMVGMVLDNSALDARPYSITGQETPKPSYTNVQGLASFAGPIRIPRLWKNPPTVFVTYQYVRDRNDSATQALLPLGSERAGDFSANPSIIYDPQTGAPFPGNVIPTNRISNEAKSLLGLYPLPNFTGSSYNYQVPLVTLTSQNALQSRVTKSITNKDQFFGQFAFQDTSSKTPNVFEFVDQGRIFGLNSLLSLQHRFTPRTFGTFQVQYSRLSTRTIPYFSNLENVSGEAGITGNNQEPVNWGPPTLQFSNGIQPLTDGIWANNRNQTMAFSYNGLWNRGRHNISWGGDFRRQEFNYLSQQNPRGTFGFTGQTTGLLQNGVQVQGTGDAFADFLLGTPTTSQINYGNADKYFRANIADVFVSDDWRVGPSLTLTYGLRWEYSSPISELYNRLVNLDVANGFSDVRPVVSNDPVGPLTGTKYPNSLIHRDLNNFAPRLAVAWRPIPASSLVVRAGYGLYYNTSVFQSIATQMAQQSPLSTSLSLQNTPATPLSLANGFTAPVGVNTNTFGVDPNFRIGYAHIWNVSVQKDLPGSLVMIATYMGIKGTRAEQEFYPNTYAPGMTSPCPSCPTGFIYLTSNGNSTRQAGTLQLRRRLHSGLTATLQYTYAKAIDDAALGGNPLPPSGSSTTSTGSTTQSSSSGSSGTGATSTLTPAAAARAALAQNWLDLSAERGLSSFDQRHVLTVAAQYTTGQGLAGGTLLSGWRGALFKEWTVTTAINAASGLPQTPAYLIPVPGTGFTGIRPDYTGAPLYAPQQPGLALNPAAYAAPAAGEWGNAGRNTITGPMQFTLNASLGRTFRLKDRYSLDLRVDSFNPINHVTWTAWNTTILNTQFGTPAGANPMRSLQTTLRLRF